MNTICHFCNTIFKRHYNLKIHLQDHRCRSYLLDNLYDLNIILNENLITIARYKYLLLKNGINDPDNTSYTNNLNIDGQNTISNTVKNNLQTELTHSIKLLDNNDTISDSNMGMIVEETTDMINDQSQFTPINMDNQETKRKRGRPKKVVIDTLQQIIRKVGRPKKEITTVGVTNLQINPITKLNLNNNSSNTEKFLIQYEKHRHDNILRLLLSIYIEKIINNKEIPENLCVKYIKKKPPTYALNIVDENDKFKTKTIVKSLKDSCDILHDIFSKIIRVELKRQLRILRQKQSKESDESEESEEYEEEYDNDTIFFLMKELKDKNKNIIKQAIKSVLHNNILYDKTMKTKL